MRSNDKILNEAFFKKTSYDDKLKKQLAQYKPYAGGDKSAIGGKPVTQAFEVSDVDELRKRLTSGIGASFANNTIKNMSNKAIKTFPIIVSDNVEPETVVMLKRYLEEQYAEYINLMISNKTIDLGSFVTDPENGNIAIQAVDSISGPDFRKDRLANKASTTGELSINDLLANVPIYNLLRQESVEFKCGDKLMDTLMEDAIIIDSEHKDRMVKLLQEETNVQDEIFLEFDPRENGYPTTKKGGNGGYKAGTLGAYLDNMYSNDNKYAKGVGTGDKNQLDPRIFALDNAADSKHNYEKMTDALDMSIGHFLKAKGNEIIRDRFEKAGLLLAARRISGNEYISYITVRLGIPVGNQDAAKIITSFPARNLTSDGINSLDHSQIERIDKGLKIVNDEIKRITKRSVKSAIADTAAVATPIAAGTAGAVILALNTAMPWFAPVISGAAGLTAGTIALISKLRKRKLVDEGKDKIQGWERVENLIQDMDRQRKDLLLQASGGSGHVSISSNIRSMTDDATTRNLNNHLKDVGYNLKTSSKVYDDNDKLDAKETLKKIELLEKAINDSIVDKKKGLNEDVKLCDIYMENLREGLSNIIENETYLLETNEDFARMHKAYYSERNTDMLNEKAIDILAPKYTKMKHITYDPKETMVTPAYSARSQYAYGSTEFDRREIKDRKYNAPLVMTITFRERLSDGKYTDNELTAMIGIQGVVVRVPSDEMKYILQSNAEGNTLKGFLGSSTIGNSIADLLSGTKVKKDVEKLPISADVWHNLEKIAHLALANKLGGKQSHNISNAHIIFSQKEVDDLRVETGIDYLKDKKLAEQLLKRYSAFSIMIVNDPSERVYVFDDPENISWNVIPYSALRNRDSSDQVTSALIRATLGRI